MEAEDSADCCDSKLLALEEGIVPDHPHALKNQHGGGGYSCGACALCTEAQVVCAQPLTPAYCCRLVPVERRSSLPVRRAVRL